ncbi:MAG: primosomal replication protein N [Rhodoferax sp.]|nr:primosomal replication protein N [Rhodoferax sp.]
MGPGANRFELTACIAELHALRYTPAGVPALNLRLEHASSVAEAGEERQVKAVLRAVALGATAERLALQPIGSCWRFTGFLATARNSKQIQLHIQDITSDP